VPFPEGVRARILIGIVVVFAVAMVMLRFVI